MFWIQCVVAAVNIVVAVVLVRGADDGGTASALVLAYAAAYVVGATLSFALLRPARRRSRAPGLLRFLLRLAVASVLAVAAAGGATYLLHELLGGDELAGRRPSTVVVAGLAGGLVLVGTARVRAAPRAHLDRRHDRPTASPPTSTLTSPYDGPQGQ